MKTIRRAEGKLAVLLPGMGAVATTMMAGVFLARRGLGKPVGSLTQLGRLQLPGAAKGPAIRDALPLADLNALEFGCWDIVADTAYESALNADVLSAKHLDAVREELSAIKPMKGVFYPEYVRRLRGEHVKSGTTKADMVEQLRDDIRSFIAAKGCSRAVAVWCGSTEVWVRPTAVHESISAFEDGLRRNDPAISASQLYAWACIKEGVPFANGAPALTCDFPAAWLLSRELGVPLAGKDFKTGQTLMKTVVAPALKSRLLGVRGWFSTNILGNRDGEVLDDPDSFRSKELSKLGVLEQILQDGDEAELYSELFHKVRIEYYPPRGDAKEGWDNIDLYGWMGYPMQLKLNFLCRDSILAAPIVLDLALFMDLARRAGQHGVQDWLSFFFKSPTTTDGRPLHDLFAQERRLHAALRALAGVETLPAGEAQAI